MSTEYKNNFLKEAPNWIVESCTIDIRYLVQRNTDGHFLLAASIHVLPFPLPQYEEFHVEAGEILGGQIQFNNQTRLDVFRILTNAADGLVEAGSHSLSLLGERRGYDYQSEMLWGDKWFSSLDLTVRSSQSITPRLSHLESCNSDTLLRQNTPPFDGINDLSAWLGFADSISSSQAPTIKIEVAPPVDLIYPNCSLSENCLRMYLRAHPNFNTDSMTLSIREFPGVGISTRQQVSSRINWQDGQDGLREGIVELELNKADSVGTTLTIGSTTVRRQWFVDPTKAPNSRYVAVQQFDSDLRQIRSAIIDPTDSNKFETGIASLLFLIGFSAAVQLEKDAPDIVVATPSGRLILVECTMKIADFSSKLGKLVDRQGSLKKTSKEAPYPFPVESILVCALPRDQIATRHDELKKHNVLLMTKEDLISTLEEVRMLIEPDKFIDSIAAKSSNPFSLMS
ncbi:MAG TPA: hypothetical protein VK149_00955 [Sideroxyarcus sp.]|nr:hypothetical protein [Sideroxyarcus sp.]